MKEIFENKYIDIDGTVILEKLKNKLEDNYNTSLVMKNNIKSIIKSKKIYLDTIDDLYTHLTWINRSNTYYFDQLAYELQDTDLSSFVIRKNIEEKIYNDAILFSFLQIYFDLGFNSNNSWKAIWREDNEQC